MNKVEKAYAKLNEAVIELEEQLEIFLLELEIEKSNPLIYLFKLILGFIFLLVSLLWQLHM